LRSASVAEDGPVVTELIDASGLEVVDVAVDDAVAVVLAEVVVVAAVVAVVVTGGAVVGMVVACVGGGASGFVVGGEGGGGGVFDANVLSAGAGLLVPAAPIQRTTSVVLYVCTVGKANEPTVGALRATNTNVSSSATAAPAAFVNRTVCRPSTVPSEHVHVALP
jgi:hypothetical protein